MTRFDGVRAVTFDCWGTLLYEPDRDASMRMRIDALAEAAGLDVPSATSLQEMAWEVHCAAWVRGEQFGSAGAVAWMAEQTSLSAGAQAHLLRVFEEAALDTGVAAVSGAGETIERLKARGIPSALVCDTGLTPGRVVRRLLGRAGLRLDAFAFSDEVGVPKPSGRMFASALAAIGGGPAVHVGDLRRTDVAGARAAGLGSVRFRGIHDDASDHPEADAVLDDLRDLPGLLGLAS
ncbi:MAG: HAD family hydrolase [Actinomycetota bacterium]